MERTKEENQCKLCKEPINLGDFEARFEIPQLMAKNHICFSCAFWMKRKEYDDRLWREYFYFSKNNLKIPVITPDWKHWVVKPFPSLVIQTGTFEHTRLEATRYYMAVVIEDRGIIGAHPNKIWLIDNNNMSHQGTIPEHLRHLYTPNGIYLSPMEWKLFQDRKTVTSDEIKNMINNAII